MKMTNLTSGTTETACVYWTAIDQYEGQQDSRTMPLVAAVALAETKAHDGCAVLVVDAGERHYSFDEVYAINGISPSSQEDGK